MRKVYEVCLVTAEVCIEVEADSEEEAKGKALELAEEMDLSLCHHCSDDMETCDPYVTAVFGPDEEKGPV
jgi:hypothetical protein